MAAAVGGRTSEVFEVRGVNIIDTDTNTGIVLHDNLAISSSHRPSSTTTPSPIAGSRRLLDSCFAFIGTLRSIYRLCVGTPRQGMLVPHSRGIITFDETFISQDLILELKQYSHVYIAQYLSFIWIATRTSCYRVPTTMSTIPMQTCHHPWLLLLPQNLLDNFHQGLHC